MRTETSAEIIRDVYKRQALCFILTYMFGIPKEVLVSDAADTDDVENIQEISDTDNVQNVPEALNGAGRGTEGTAVLSPVNGQIIPLEQVKDATFAQKKMCIRDRCIPVHTAMLHVTLWK